MSPRPSSSAAPVSRPDTHPSENHIAIRREPSPSLALGPNPGTHQVGSSGRNDTTTVEPPPAFGEKQSPEVMPKAFFFYGFVMPLFWLLGALVLTVKLRAIPPEVCGKTVEEQADMLQLLRQAEEKWAYRCLGALVAFLLVAAVVSISVVVAKGLS
ncbi:hypothetical protein M407DRAFT_22084 [Tulasnella calospora MUT 4182]|uniref:Transmembrane protein n=1 Tax=Tulasnella calospora MUT 4182 TaxID=1051891 RepID=A0A0C3L516_9AGAM|nr:hypothetical protein M407DRAFT_22084 [Tulasnella calospora MUT 4182]